MTVLVRTWNLFHGNTWPRTRKAYLREMIELATADDPGVVCLQEVPAWALKKVGPWAGMESVWMRTRRTSLGPLPVPGEVARRLTALDAGFFRSAFDGQGNVILFPNGATVRETKGVTLNTNPFVEEQGRKLGLPLKVVRAWEHERRVCHLVKFELPDRRRVLVANLHATSYENDTRLPDAELQRAARFVDRASDVDELTVMAGDFNVTLDASLTMQDMLAAPPESRWLQTGGRIDHIMVRNGTIASARAWPDAEREYAGRVLSDHAPVDAMLEPAG
jgi:endonuclease/exonuclease/phosphatase family metal-dependent hydrolase